MVFKLVGLPTSTFVVLTSVALEFQPDAPQGVIKLRKKY